MNIVSLATGWAIGVGISTIAALLIFAMIAGWRHRLGWHL
jgi:hypothetical protein